MVAHVKREKPKVRINYDRGVIFRQHDPSGINVYMYVDEPGIYRNAFETEISEKLAAEAGFPVEQYRRERVRREKMKDAMSAIDAQLAEITPEQHRVVAERGGFKLLDIGLGRFNVVDDAGGVLNTTPLTEEIGTKLFERLAPEGSEAKKAE